MTEKLDEFEVRVVRRSEAAEGVVMLELQRSDDQPFPSWVPGSHVDLHLGEGIVRQYSLCSAPGDARTWKIAVLREENGKGGSKAIHDKVIEGSTLLVGNPRNNFALQSAPAYRFIAGGIGITPILPMIAEAHEAGAEWTLLYGGRCRASMAFTDHLARYGSRVRVRPQDEYGLLDLTSYLSDPRQGELIYACGPTPMLRAVEEVTASWPSGALHTELFVPQTVDKSEDVAFDVEFALTGKTVTVGANETILEIAEGLGIGILSSCREGTCGTCETVVLEGEVDHRDVILNEEERAASESMMICVSRAKSGCPRLSLEL